MQNDDMSAGETPEKRLHRVMVVDDSAVIRGLETRVLESDPDIKVVASVDSGAAAIAALDTHEIDVVILDIEMPVMDGLTALPLLLEKRPNLTVIMSSALSQSNANLSFLALTLGAADYIPKPSSSNQLTGEGDYKTALIHKVKALTAASHRASLKEAPAVQGAFSPNERRFRAERATGPVEDGRPRRQAFSAPNLPPTLGNAPLPSAPAPQTLPTMPPGMPSGIGSGAGSASPLERQTALTNFPSVAAVRGDAEATDVVKPEVYARENKVVPPRAASPARTTAPNAAKRTPPPPSSSPVARAAERSAPVTSSNPSPSPMPGGAGSFVTRSAGTERPDVIVIGSSTGGPQALFTLLNGLRKAGGVTQPILITQHMPVTFTTILAEHITRQTGFPAREGQDGERIEGGRVYVAPGDYHMTVEGKGSEKVIRLNHGEPENFCRPAVDPLFRSVAKVWGKKVLACILTGMGSDGSRGGKIVVEAGGTLIAQDEATSVVWGMPGAAAATGMCSAVLPIGEMAGWVYKFANRRAG